MLSRAKISVRISLLYPW